MTDFVVDANVWVMADRTITDGLALEEENCIKACRDWLETLVQSKDRLVVDWDYAIIAEYRRNISHGGFAEIRLNRIESESIPRFVRVTLDRDSNKHAVLPNGLTLDDPSDRKYVAAAVQLMPYAPIYNAADTDWAKERAGLEAYGLIIHELCPELISAYQS